VIHKRQAGEKPVAVDLQVGRGQAQDILMVLTGEREYFTEVASTYGREILRKGSEGGAAIPKMSFIR
jgi:hypothetical protein